MQRMLATEPVRVPCHGIVIRTLAPDRLAIRSEMKRALPTPDQFNEILDYLSALKEAESFNNRARALEALILAHHCAGIDVQSLGYIDGIDAAYHAIATQV